MDVFFQFLVSVLSLGGVYALLALGLVVVFGLLGFLNFAHGDLMTLFGYGLFYLVAAGVWFPVAAVAAIGFAGICALLMERIAFRSVRNSSGATMLVTSFAVSMILQVLFQNFISTRSQPVILPQILFSEFMVQREYFSDVVLVVEKAMPVRWGYEIFRQLAEVCGSGLSPHGRAVCPTEWSQVWAIRRGFP